MSVYFDETGTDVQASRIMVGAVVTLDADILERSVRERSEHLAADNSMWPIASKRTDFVIRGFHHCEDDETVRDRFLDAIRTLNFRAHVLYSSRTIQGLNDDDSLIAMYYTVIRNLLRRYAGEQIELTFETNSSLDSYYGALTVEAVTSLGTAPRAASVSARIGSKPLGGLSVVDYVLAATEHHLQAEDGRDIPNFRKARFARISGHLAHIMDFDAAAHKHKLGRLL